MSRKSKFLIAKISIVAVFLAVVAILLVVIYTYGSFLHKYKKPVIDVGAYQAERVLTDTEVAQDVNELLTLVEKSHPLYKKCSDTPEYIAAKKALLELKSMTVGALNLEVARYLVTFADLQTRILLYDRTILDTKQLALCFDTEKRTYLAKEAYGSIPKNAELKKIDGLDVQRLLKDIETIHPSENNNTAVFYAELMLMPAVIDTFGGDSSDGVKLTFVSASGETEEVFGVKPYERPAPDADGGNFSVTFKGGVVMVKVKNFEDDGSFEACLKTVIAAVEDGAYKVVVDVRGGDGRKSEPGEKLLKEIGMEVSEAGEYLRFSELTKKYFGTIRVDGVKHSDFKYKSANKSSTQLRVLVDETSVNAAADFAARVKYSGIGLLVGRPSGQRPNHCGNAVPCQLGISKIIYAIPVSYGFFLADGEPVGDIADTDIYVAPNQNIEDFIHFDTVL